MRILFLDDDPHRIADFQWRMHPHGHDITVVETAHDCIRCLAADSFDLVLLDHDLGGETYCDSSREDCGMEVVRFLVASRPEQGPIIVHSMNSIAAAEMFIQLRQQGYSVRQAPFGSPDFVLHLHELLGIEQQPQRRKKSIGDRLRGYFRSLRLGR